jgi:hypothetical protein
LIDITHKDHPTFTYAYWDNPDKVMHKEGTNSKGVRKTMKDINKHLNKLNKQMKDTCLIITADHGHIDCKPIYIRQYKELYCMLKRIPSNEARCTFFKVNDNKHEDFKKLFNELFSDKFILMTGKEFIENEFLGLKKYSVNHDRIEEIVGEITDEYDKAETTYNQISDNTFLFNAKTSIIDFCKIMGLSDETFDDMRGDSETLAGLILEVVGEIPAEKENVSISNFDFLIVKADNRRIEQVQVTLKQE